MWEGVHNTERSGPSHPKGRHYRRTEEGALVQGGGTFDRQSFRPGHHEQGEVDQ